MEFDIKTIKTGDNLLVSSHSWLAKKIQLFQNNKWNHSAMFWWAYDELFVIEADKYGIAITPFSQYLKSDSGLMVLKPNFAVDGAKMGAFMLPFCGHTPYDKTNLILDQAIKFITAGKVWIGKNKKDASKKFICGEWVAFVYNNFNEDIFPAWNKIAPSEIWADLHFTHILIRE